MQHYSSREIGSRRQAASRRPHSPTLLYVVVIVLLVILLGILAYMYFGNNNKLPGDVSADQFNSLLNAGKTEEACNYWNEALNRHPKQAKIINETLTPVLNDFVCQCVLYTQNDNYEETIFVSKFANLSLFGDRAMPFFNDGIDALLDAYINRGITYERASNAFTRLGTISMLTARATEAKATVSGYETSRNAYSAALTLAQSGDYAAALEQLEKVNRTDEALYAEAQTKRSEYVSALYTDVTVKAEQYASKYNYAKAVELLLTLQKYYPDDAQISSLISTYQARANQTLVNFNGTVVSLFTHCLVAFPELGFSGSYHADCIDAKEFKRILEALYEHDYILIDMNMLYEEGEKNGTRVQVKKASFKLPQGKKPFVFSVDDVVYAHNKMGQGMVDKLILDEAGRIATFTSGAHNPTGRDLVSYDNEVFPILESFIAEHPDFSFNGARGTIALTGFDGILGYRTQKGSPNRESEIEACRKVVAALKECGWSFGSHSYGHYHMDRIATDSAYASRYINEDGFVAEVWQWEEEVVPLVGETALYFYPYGGYYFDGKMPNNFKNIGKMHQALVDAGFRIFFNVDTNPILWNFADGQGLFMHRFALDGTNLTSSSWRNRFLNTYGMFDTKDIYDHEMRKVAYPN
ncbi:MAG: hypothetical protein KIG36_06180 [Eubacteriales bacterium]|nr:hypothetical protein [Eubacteriales bacterium]